MTDIGPAGEDQGKGGKYLLLPPDFKGDTPAGFFPVRYPTYNGYALYRAIRTGQSDADATAALALVKKLRVYPLAQQSSPPEQRFIDIHGKTYLDMMGSSSRANSLGYANEEIARAMYEQAMRLHYIGSGRNVTEPMVKLATRIAELAPGRLSKVMFVSGGSEAVETAFKIAKQYHQASGKKPSAYKIISRWNAFHGATMGALSATDWLPVRETIDPRVPGYSFVGNPLSYRNPLGMSVEDYERRLATGYRTGLY